MSLRSSSLGATQVKTLSQDPSVYISFRGAELRRTFVSHLYAALKRNGINAFIDIDLEKGEKFENLFTRIEKSKVALAILSSRYTESRWCLEELVKIKECVDRRTLCVIPIFYKLEPSTVKELDGDFGLNLWNQVKRSRQYERLKEWREALDFVSQKMGFVFNGKSDDEWSFIDSIVEQVKTVINMISLEQIEKSHDYCLSDQQEDASIDYPRLEDLKGVAGERYGILWDTKTDRSPTEAEIVQAEAKSRRDVGLNPSEDDNFLGKTNSDATSKLHNSAEINEIDHHIIKWEEALKSVEVNEENKQENVGENSTMVTYDNSLVKHKVLISFRGANLSHGFVSHLVKALEKDGVDVYIDVDEKIEEYRIVLVIFSSRYTGSILSLDELVKIKELMVESKLLVIPIFYMVNPSQVEMLSGCFGDDFRDLIWTHPDHHIIKWERALKSIAARPGLVFDNNSDESETDFIITIAVHVKHVTTQISLEQIEKSHDRLSEQQDDTFMASSRSEDLIGVEGESDGILWDKKSDRNPKEVEIVQAEAKSRRDDSLNPRKDENFLDKRVDPVIEEKKQDNISESSTMVTYDKPLPEHPEVFINFCGADLRHGFVDHLAKALKRDGVNVYIDVDELLHEDITKLLFKQIEESRIALVIFSSRYTESRGILNKLVKIKELMDEGKLIVIPIFYKVEPFEVRQLKGDLGVKFWNLWRINRDHHIIKWKEALESVASMVGIYSKENSSESDFITVTVKKVLERISLPREKSTEFPTRKGEKHETYRNKHHLFGMELRMERLEKKLEFDCNETRIVGVVGMPGIGKTTLAMMLHDKWNCKFLRCVPLIGIRKKAEDYGPVWLRKTLLEVLLEGKNPVISDEITHESVKHKLLQTKSFVILDDVSNKKQLELLLGDLDWIKKGSKIVITTCDKSLLEGFSHDTYEVPELDDREAFQLFSYHAFGDQTCSPTGAFLTLSRMFVAYARGHPLALSLLGRELHGKDKGHWEYILEAVTKNSNMLFQDVWRFFTDQLNERQKDVFLDIVCFFKSEDEHFVRSLLDSHNPDSTNAVSEVKDLVKKFLITISDGRVEMNGLLYALGKDIGSRRWLRMWNYKDIISKLKKMELSDAHNVRGIFLDMSKVTESIYFDSSTFIDMRNLRYLKIDDCCCPRQCKVNGKLYFSDGLKFPLEEVQYLHWLKFPLKELPTDFIPRNLVDLRLPHSKIERVWEGVKDTPRLKWVDLSHSSNLLDLSALSRAENLQRLNLEGCKILDKLPVEIQNMKSLVFMNMRGCTRLSYLPEMNLISLKTLILSDCLNLEKFQLISENLEVLLLDGTAIKGLPPAIKKLQRLVVLNLKNCKMLECLPNCLRKLKSLEELILSGCSRLKNLSVIRENMKHLQSLLIDRIGAKVMPNISCATISEGQASADMVFLQPFGPREWPRGVNEVSSLRRLCLSGNDFVSLQTDIGKLYNLNWLDVKECKKLTSIPMLPPRLLYFDAHGCDSLERVANPLALPVLSEQIHATFNFSNCNNLDQDATDSIISYIRWKSELVLDALSRHKGGYDLEDFTGTCFPGWEIPAWFSHQASGSVLEPKLPPHWCDNRVTGIALCAVILFPSYHKQRNHLLVKCNCVFNYEDRSHIRFNCIFGRWSEPSNTPVKTESSHVFIGYTSMLDIKKHNEEEDEEGCSCKALHRSSFEFQLTDGTEVLENCEVLKCGFSLIYETDERESISWDAKTVNIPAEAQSYGNSRSDDDIQYKSYSGLTMGRAESFFSKAKSDATPNLQKSFENKRADLINEESDAKREIIVSSYRDNTSSGNLKELNMHPLVGFELRLKQMEKVLYSTPGKTRIVGVVGMPGIGKTTLATILFEKHGCKFPNHLFLTMSEKYSLEQLRSVFLKELLKHVNQDIDDETTHESVKNKLLQTKVFVVLDDVRDKKQLEFLLGNLNWIKKGSKIVITTRYKSLLEGLAHDTYMVQQLKNREAFQLFTYHAFYNQMCLSESLLSLSRMFVDNVPGNPLDLKLLGSDLCGKDEAYWQLELRRVRQSFNMKMRDVWRFSIDQLNERQRDVFLDIVFFFKSEEEYFVKSILDSGNPEDVSEVRDLADKFLITLSCGRVEMHDQMYTLGKELGSPRQHRLCNYKDIINKDQEENNVRGIFLDMSEVKDNIALERMTFTDMRNLLYLKIYDSYCPRKRKDDCNLYIPDGLEFPLEKVRYLHWVKCPLEELPPDFTPKNLVDLRLPYSKIERVWEGVKNTPRLKWVDLSHSSKLIDLSALSNAENLQRLNLEGCTSLDDLPVEIQNMKSLVFLNLRGCIRLCYLRKMNLISLKTLILSDCSNLKKFQLISESVKFLHLDGTAIEGLPPAIKNLQRLVVLNLKNCKMLECLPNCLGELKFLDELILSGCSRLKSLPDVRHSLKHLQILLLDGTGANEMPSISCFTRSKGLDSADISLQSFGLYSTVREHACGVNGVSSLRRLILSGNDFATLQPDIGKLYNLNWLDVKQCTKLIFVPMLPPRLQYFDAHGCDSLERVANPLALPVLSEQNHATFIFSNCNKLDQDSKDSIMSYTRWRSQLMLDKLTRYNEGFILEAFTGTCFPGWEVPAWFSHRAFGAVLKLKLPLHWSDNRFSGIALCAVISFHGYHEQRNRLLVKCNCVFNNKDGSLVSFSFTIGSSRESSDIPGKIELCHVFIGYTVMLDIKKLGEEDEEGCSNTEASFEFEVTDGTEVLDGCEVLKCGFSFVYATDELQVKSGVRGALSEANHYRAYSKNAISDVRMETEAEERSQDGGIATTSQPPIARPLDSQELPEEEEEIPKVHKFHNRASSITEAGEQRLKQLEEKLDVECNDNETRIVSIVGMVGIGKTYLAKKLVEKLEKKIFRHVFIQFDSDKSEEQGLYWVQKRIVKGLLKLDLSCDDGNTFEDCKVLLIKRKVVIVFDNVTDQNQIQPFLSNCDWIKKGSRILITTRNKSLTEGFELNLYEVPGLNERDGLELFSGQLCTTLEGNFMEMSRKFVDFAGGNPLALKAFGEELKEKSEGYWERRLETLTQVSNEDIKKVFRNSFENDLNEKQKDALLDIVCFFRSQEESYVTSLLDSIDTNSAEAGREEIRDLVDKFLIHISDGRVEMHDLLFTMGKELVETAPGKHWILSTNCAVSVDALRNKKGRSQVRGIVIDTSKMEEMPLDNQAFVGMSNLRYLKVYNSLCPRHGEAQCKLYLPDELEFPEDNIIRYLDWMNFPGKELPSHFEPKNLIDLRLPYSKITSVWSVTKGTPNLKWLDLSHSTMLSSLLGLSEAPNLLRVNLEGCTSLEKLPEEMKEMQCLVFLNLRGCTSLLSLPKITIDSLKTLILSGCSNLQTFEVISAHLEILYINGTAIDGLPPAIGNLHRLIFLNLKDCKNLATLPDCLGKLKSLQELKLSRCSKLKIFPDVKEMNENLQVLLLDGTSIGEMPGSIFDLSYLRRLCLSRNNNICSLQFDMGIMFNLKWLELKYCKNLTSLPILPPNLQCLNAHGCTSLRTVASPLARLLPTEQIHSTFIFTNCHELEQVSKNAIISYIQKKSELHSADRYNQDSVFKSLIGTCFPGCEIPAWFNHQASGSVLKLELPQDWNAGRLIGIALCVVVSFNKDQNNSFQVKCTCEFTNVFLSPESFLVGGWSEPGDETHTVESDHIFIGYTTLFNINKHQQFPSITEASLRFEVTNGTSEVEECKVIQCGLSLVYESDEAKNTSWKDTPRMEDNTQGERSSSNTGDDCPSPTPETADYKRRNSFFKYLWN